MKAKVIVKLKEGVLDPQGETIRRALSKMGYSDVQKVRQGKYFELEIEEGAAASEVRSRLEKVAREVLSNPIIECYEIEDVS